jgi:hypothetical protein
MYVFGYGSLSAQAAGAHVATLAGFIRTWDVAMDNRARIPGYKYYVDPISGLAPAVSVTFLNLALQTGVACAGFLLPVDTEELVALDARERNYGRVEVTQRIRTAAHELSGPVYAYLGTRAARQRYASAVAAGSAVISRAYREAVEDGFNHAGMLGAYHASTRPPECPVRELTRVNLAAGSPAPGPAAASAPRRDRPGTRFPRH